jgi:hypothetical protein
VGDFHRGVRSLRPGLPIVSIAVLGLFMIILIISGALLPYGGPRLLVGSFSLATASNSAPFPANAIIFLSKGKFVR